MRGFAELKMKEISAALLFILLINTGITNGCWSRNKEPKPVPEVRIETSTKCSSGCFKVQKPMTERKSHETQSKISPLNASRNSQPRINVTSADLRKLSEDLLDLDTNNVGRTIQLNLQGVTTSAANNDKAPSPLFGSIPKNALEAKTYKLFEKLLDNYNADVTVKEDNLRVEREEEEAFLEEILKTKVMKGLESFLNERGFISGSLRSDLQRLWFRPYSRSRRVIGSSGFEHVFLGEIKNKQVSGLHNWVFFMKEEKAGVLDYKGYMKYVDLGNQGAIIKLRFDWMNFRKSVGSMFVGTSPELEMALYTLCYFAREGKSCSMSLNGKRFAIKVYTENRRGTKLIGSAYPEIY